jgi:hypothetical protein
VKDIVEKSLYRFVGPPVIPLIEINIVGNARKHLIDVLLVWRDVHTDAAPS